MFKTTPSRPGIACGPQGAVAVIMCLGVPALAQAQLTEANVVAVGQGLVAGSAFEIRTAERFLMERQSRALTAMGDRTRWLHVTQADDHAITFAFQSAEASDGARLALAPDGSILTSDAWVGPRRQSAFNRIRSSADSMRVVNRLLWTSIGPRFERRVSLPDARVWHILPVVPQRELGVGDMWIDTISLSTHQGGFSQEWTGVRTSFVIADSTVEGRPYWLISDSTELRYAVAGPEYEQTFDAFSSRERLLEGVHRGRYLLDREGRVPRIRSDTTRLAGTETVTLPDGRTFTNRVAWERSQVVRLWEPEELVAQEEELRVARRRRRGVQTVSESESREWERLHSGAPEVLDSLMAIARSTLPRDQRIEALQEARRAVFRGPSRNREHAEVELLLAVGDTTSALREMAGLGGFSEPGDVADIEALLPLLRSPELTRSYGLREDALFSGILSRLLTSPPAGSGADSLSACLPNACALLAEQWSRPNDEPRLAALGLVTRFVTDPGTWSDTVLARTDVFLEPARSLALGIGARPSNRGSVPIPDPGADWYSWDVWTRGGPPDDEEAPRFERSHRTAIRMTEARTGRDIEGEIAALYAAADSDPAKLTLGTIRAGLGHRLTLEEAARALEFGSPAERTVATRQFRDVWWDWPPADSALTAELMNRGLSVFFGESESWPYIAPDPSTPYGFREFTSMVEGVPLLMLDTDVPASVAERWSDRLTVVDSATLAARLREVAPVLVLQWQPVVANGPYAYANLGYRHRYDFDGIVQAVSGNFGVGLLQTRDGWRIFWATEGIS